MELRVRVAKRGSRARARWAEDPGIFEMDADRHLHQTIGEEGTMFVVEPECSICPRSLHVQGCRGGALLTCMKCAVAAIAFTAVLLRPHLCSC